MTIEERFRQVDFSRGSRIKDSLFLRMKLRRNEILEEMSFEEMDEVVAAGSTYIKPDDVKNK